MYIESTKMPPDSRIWVYQANRPLRDTEASSISERTKIFLETWTTHDQALKASFEIRYNLFLIIMIDKNYEQASGCSIDKSVHFVQLLEKDLNLTLLDRMVFAFKENDAVRVVSKKEFSSLLSQGIVNDDTIVFNNLVQSKQELSKDWEVPMRKSWHKSLV